MTVESRETRPLPDILAQIVGNEREVIERARAVRTVEDLRRAPGYATARRSLLRSLAERSPGIIAECKHRSPSRGVLRDPYDPVAIARSYEAAGAAGISVLTNEKFFGGALAHLAAVREAVSIPVLRKDFVLDAYQLEEARAAGADAVLLIAAALSAEALVGLFGAARDIGLEVLVEVHDDVELEAALRCEGALLGINNRDLRTFRTELETTERLVQRIPSGTRVVAESGLRNRADLDRLRGSGVDAFLVGEAFMTATDPGAALRAMLGGGKSA